MRARTRWMASLLAVGLAAGPSAASAPVRPDAWLTARVKLALLGSSEVSARDVDVDTVRGRVALHGFAATDAERARAVELASGVDGVRGVLDLLQVRNERVRDQLHARDRRLEQRLENTLERDRALAGSRVRVRSVHDGVVLLGGEAGSLAAHRRALDLASGVVGVRGLASEIESPDASGDEALWRVGGFQPGGLEQRVRDLWIAGRARVRLLADRGASSLDVDVDVRGGVVTLFGSVPTRAVRSAMEGRVRALRGVRAVDDEIQVVPHEQRAGMDEDDGVIRTSIQQQIERRRELADASLSVEVSNRVARLSGRVTGAGDQRTALALARQTPGVRAVLDDLRVEPAPRPAGPTD